MFSIPKIKLVFDVIRKEDKVVRVYLKNPLGKPKTTIINTNHVLYELAVYKGIAREFNRQKVFGFTNWKVDSGKVLSTGILNDRFWLYGGTKKDKVYLCHSDYAISWLDEALANNRYTTFL